MAEIITDMLTNRLWIYTAIAGSLLGAAFLFWFKDTKLATWAVSKFDGTLEYLAKRWVGHGYRMTQTLGVKDIQE